MNKYSIARSRISDKTKKQSTGPNKVLLEQFNKLRELVKYQMMSSDKKTKLAQSFRLKAIDTVIDTISKFTTKITSSEQVKDLPGFGSGTVSRIDEILRTGKLAELESLGPEQDTRKLMEQRIKYIEELTEIFGIGEKLAGKLVDQYNIKSIDDLIKLYNKSGPELNLPSAVVKGIKYHGIVKENIPHEEIEEIDNYLSSILLEIDPELFGIICGSYRRMKPTSGDIDMLIVHPNPKPNTNYLTKFVRRLVDEKFIVDSLTDETNITKYMGYCKFKSYPIRRIDIRYIPYKSYYTATLYFTGPKNFNRRMRNLAQSLGYKLNEYELLDDNDKPIKVNSEKDVFDALGMEYVSPEKR